MNSEKEKNNSRTIRMDFISGSYFQSIVIVVLLIVFIGFAIRPSIMTAIRLRKELHEYRTLNGKFDENLENIRTIKQNYESVSKYTELLDKALPEKADEGNFLNKLNFLAAKSQITLKDLRFDYTENEGLGELKFSASLIGDYVKILSFLESLNQLLRITVIDEINFAPQKDKSLRGESGTLLVRIDISGRTFYAAK